MNDSEDFKEKRSKDQVDGSGMSLGKRKGVKVTGRYGTHVDWSSPGQGPSIIHSPSSSSPIPSDTPTVISISPLPHRAPERGDHSGMDDPSIQEDWTREASSSSSSQSRVSYRETSVPRQTMEELKTILRDGPLLSVRPRDEGKPGGPYTYLHGSSRDGSPHRAFSTFKPLSDASRRGPRSTETTSIQPPPSVDSSSSFRADADTNRRPEVSALSHATFIAAMETIKQQIARENINFVRFEATDLHGVSRSKTVPVRFFQEKAVYGVPMPRSYLELTLSPKSNEVDSADTANFNSDVLLIPDLGTFRVLPWAEQTARVICDPCTVTGSPLRTSPRLIAKQLLGELRSLGFSLRCAFTYECCVLGAPDRIGPKTLLFPATTLLSNHDLPFSQQLVDGMYCMGADIDSVASASGPGQMEINLRPEFGIAAADSAFTFRTGMKELARKHSYIASFFTDDGLHNAGVLSHSLWDANGRRSLFQAAEKAGDLSEIGRRWLSGLLTHSAALSCLTSPGLGCRSHMAKTVRDPRRVVYATCGRNDNCSSFNVKSHGGRETHIDNKLGSAMANPYVVLAATVAAGLDGVRRNLTSADGPPQTGAPGRQREFPIPVKLDEALEALGQDHIIRTSLGEPFVQYFIAMKKFEIETQELDDERNKCLEYFI
uniref:Lengsin n=1 Tax=Echeneis naucrates TaxID=173247 RepID=A0A665VSP4_ECHNA